MPGGFSKLSQAKVHRVVKKILLSHLRSCFAKNLGGKAQKNISPHFSHEPNHVQSYCISGHEFLVTVYLVLLVTPIFSPSHGLRPTLCS
jgi:hypothetical protein